MLHTAIFRAAGKVRDPYLSHFLTSCFGSTLSSTGGFPAVAS
jgi:hypothetical protein